jgi:hypothetical protein
VRHGQSLFADEICLSFSEQAIEQSSNQSSPSEGGVEATCEENGENRCASVASIHNDGEDRGETEEEGKQ